MDVNAAGVGCAGRPRASAVHMLQIELDNDVFAFEQQFDIAGDGLSLVARVYAHICDLCQFPAFELLSSVC